MGRRPSIWDCRCRQPRAAYPRASDGPPSNARAGGGATRFRFPLGLAPGGVYRAAAVTCGAGGLLHHRFTLTVPGRPSAGLGRRSVFCGTVPRVTPGRCYRPPCPAEPGPSSPRIARRGRPADSLATARIRPPLPLRVPQPQGAGPFAHVAGRPASSVRRLRAEKLANGQRLFLSWRSRACRGSSLAWFEVSRHGVPVLRELIHQHRHQRIISPHSAILPPKSRNVR